MTGIKMGDNEDVFPYTSMETRQELFNVRHFPDPNNHMSFKDMH